MTLRFALVTTFYPPHHFGGDAVFIQRLARALVRRGHEVEVLHDVDAYRLLRNDEGLPSSRHQEDDGVVRHEMRSRLGALSPLLVQQTGHPLLQRRRLRRILEGGGFDVIHFHNISLVGGPGILRLGDAVKLYMAHEHWLVCPTSVLWRHNRELCSERQCLRCQIRHRRPPQLWRYTGLLERAIDDIDAFISPSRFSAEKHRELGFPREMEVLPYFLPDPGGGEEVPERHVDDIEDRPPYFLFVGRLERIKGLQDILGHFPADGPFELLVAGQGGYEAELRRLAQGRRVHFLGGRSPQQLRCLYRDATAVIVPSLCYETFGIVLLEAFREGVPVVCRRRGPFVEIVQQSGAGLLFDSDEDLGHALHSLAGDEALRRRLGDAGRQALEERWTESPVLDRYLELVESLRQRRSRAAAK